MNRYIIVQEPTCTWAVFDAILDRPAILENRVAVGLDRLDAVDMAARANELLGAEAVCRFPGRMAASAG